MSHSFLGSPFSENRGKLLENIVAQELLRRGNQLFFFKGRGECDFILKPGTKPDNAIQVCWELNQKNEKRELAGLAEAMKEFNLEHGTILTYNQENTVKHDCYEIPVIPTWKWLTLGD